MLASTPYNRGSAGAGVAGIPLSLDMMKHKCHATGFAK